MTNSEGLSTQTRGDLMRYLKREVSSRDEFNDKLRILIIISLTSTDSNLLKEAT